MASLKDLYPLIASQAMQALLSNPVASACLVRDLENTGRDFCQEVAHVSCDMADALIQELKRRRIE